MPGTGRYRVSGVARVAGRAIRPGDRRRDVLPQSRNLKAMRASAPEPLETFVVGDAERESPAEGVLGDAGEVAKGGVNVFRADPDPPLPVAGQGLRIEGDVELPLVGGADGPAPLDAPA